MYIRYGIINRLILLYYTKFTTVNQPLVNPNFENFFVDKQQRILRFHTVYTFFKLIAFIHLRITEFCESVSFVQPYRSFVVRLCFKTDSCNIGIFLFKNLKNSPVMPLQRCSGFTYISSSHTTIPPASFE